MATQALRFREAKRTQESFLASMEKKTLLWLAARTPGWINSDHLTALGLLAMAAFLCGDLAGQDRHGRLAVELAQMARARKGSPSR